MWHLILHDKTLDISRIGCKKNWKLDTMKDFDMKDVGLRIYTICGLQDEIKDSCHFLKLHITYSAPIAVSANNASILASSSRATFRASTFPYGARKLLILS